MKHILHQNTHWNSHSQEEPFGFCKHGPIPRDRAGENLLIFSKHLIPKTFLWSCGKGSGKCALRWHGWNEEWELFCLLHSFWKRQWEQKKHLCWSAFSVPELKGTIMQECPIPIPTQGLAKQQGKPTRACGLCLRTLWSPIQHLWRSLWRQSPLPQLSPGALARSTQKEFHFRAGGGSAPFQQLTKESFKYMGAGSSGKVKVHLLKWISFLKK